MRKPPDLAQVPADVRQVTSSLTPTETTKTVRAAAALARRLLRHPELASADQTLQARASADAGTSSSSKPLMLSRTRRPPRARVRLS